MDNSDPDEKINNIINQIIESTASIDSTSPQFYSSDSARSENALDSRYRLRSATVPNTSNQSGLEHSSEIHRLLSVTSRDGAFDQSTYGRLTGDLLHAQNYEPNESNLFTGTAAQFTSFYPPFQGEQLSSSIQNPGYDDRLQQIVQCVPNNPESSISDSRLSQECGLNPNSTTLIDNNEYISACQSFNVVQDLIDQIDADFMEHETNISTRDLLSSLLMSIDQGNLRTGSSFDYMEDNIAISSTTSFNNTHETGCTSVANPVDHREFTGSTHLRSTLDLSSQLHQSEDTSLSGNINFFQDPQTEQTIHNNELIKLATSLLLPSSSSSNVLTNQQQERRVHQASDVSQSQSKTKRTRGDSGSSSGDVANSFRIANNTLMIPLNDILREALGKSALTAGESPKSSGNRISHESKRRKGSLHPTRSSVRCNATKARGCLKNTGSRSKKMTSSSDGSAHVKPIVGSPRGRPRKKIIDDASEAQKSSTKPIRQGTTESSLDHLSSNQLSSLSAKPPPSPNSIFKKQNINKSSSVRTNSVKTILDSLTNPDFRKDLTHPTLTTSVSSDVTRSQLGNQPLGCVKDPLAGRSQYDKPRKRQKMESNQSNEYVNMFGKKQFRNKFISAYPVVRTQSTSCNPVSFNRSTQTEDSLLDDADELPPTGFVPIPVTIPIPLPLLPTSSIVPFFLPLPSVLPVPIPVPIPVLMESGSNNERISQTNELVATGRHSLQLSTQPTLLSTSYLNFEQLNAILNTPDFCCTDEPESNQPQGLSLMGFDDPTETDVLLSVKITHQGAYNRMHWISGIRIFCQWIASTIKACRQNLGQETISLDSRNDNLDSSTMQWFADLPSNFLQFQSTDLSLALSEFICRARKRNGELFEMDVLLLICICVHFCLCHHLQRLKDQIFFDYEFVNFTDTLHRTLLNREQMVTISSDGSFISRVDEELMWACGLFGSHNPFVLLNTLLYLNSRYFFVFGIGDHLSLRFDEIMLYNKPLTRPERRNEPNRNDVGSSQCSSAVSYADDEILLFGERESSQGQAETIMDRHIDPPAHQRLRCYCVHNGNVIYEQSQNLSKPERCPVRLFRFYLSKCPPSLLTNMQDRHPGHVNVLRPTGPLYLEPERNFNKDSKIWFTSQKIDSHQLEKMHLRLQSVKELLETQMCSHTAFH